MHQLQVVFARKFRHAAERLRLAGYRAHQQLYAEVEGQDAQSVLTCERGLQIRGQLRVQVRREVGAALRHLRGIAAGEVHVHVRAGVHRREHLVGAVEVHQLDRPCRVGGVVLVHQRQYAERAGEHLSGHAEHQRACLRTILPGVRRRSRRGDIPAAARDSKTERQRQKGADYTFTVHDTASYTIL